MDDEEQTDSKKVYVTNIPEMFEVNGFKLEVTSTDDTSVSGRSDSCNNEATNVSVNNHTINTTHTCVNNESAITTPNVASTLTNISKSDTVLVNTVNNNIARIPNMLAGVILNGNVKCTMEIDSGACEPVITYDCYKDIVSHAIGQPPILHTNKVKMSMADGTPSSAVKGCINLQITRADKLDRSCFTRVLVVDGPHALLGRSVIKSLWPEEYAHLENIAKESLDAICNKTCSVCKSLSSCQDNTAAAAASAGDCNPAILQQRPIPPAPSGVITQEIGEAYCKKICDEVFPELFDGGLGEFKGVTADIKIKEGHEKYLKVMPCAKVPHGIAKPFYKELDKFAQTCSKVDGRGLKVATQLVPVVKKKGNDIKIRLCGNYKRTINDHIEDEHHQFTSCNDQLDKLIGSHYTCLDFKGGYTQIPVEPLSKPICTLNTPIGFLQPDRMTFGLKTAPKIFQAAVDRLIQGVEGKGPIPNTACVVDDICTTGPTPQEHFNNLIELLSRLHAAGVKLNKDKCKFYQKEVKFLGKIIDKNGKRMDPASIDAIINMPAPTDKHTLRSFLGHMSYIGRHVPDIRIARAPLDALLKKDVKFIWEDTHVKAFNMCKKLASNPATLAHYDETLPMILTTDASPAGIAACLAHRVTENGKTFLKPLSYASCSLKPAERNYAQIDREGLAVVWAMRHYRHFILGKKIELHTDCSALTRIFGPKNDLGGCAIGRLNRYAAELMEYDFTVIHIKGTNNKICDSLSRLPVPPKGDILAPAPLQVGQTMSSEELAQNMSVKFTEVESTNNILDLVKCLALLPDPKVETVSICKILGTASTAVWDILPLSVKDVAKATREDKVFGKLLSAVRSGELDKNDIDMKPFSSIFENLYVEQGVIRHGSRVVVPTKQQERLLSELHMTHMGIVKMKLVSREYFWWPQINKQIEAIAKSCEGCNKYRKRPAPAPLCPWPYARRPMERVHVDFCEFNSKQLLLMIDAYSKYIWVHLMNMDTTAMKTLAVLYGWFCEKKWISSYLG